MIIYLLRHAEKLLGPNEDGLTPAGFARAQLLAGMLANSGITVAFRTQFVRSQQTMEPLKNMLGDALEIKTVELPNLAEENAHVEKIVNQIKSLPDERVVLVVSHDSTIKKIVKKLGGGEIDDIHSQQFDKLFVLFRLPPDKIGLAKLKYGKPTP